MPKVTQVKSKNGSTQRQLDTLRSLGLRRIGQTVEVKDNEQTRGMLHRVRHLIEFLDLAVRDPALLERLARETLEYKVPGRGLTQLDQLGAGGTDIQPDHGRMRP